MKRLPRSVVIATLIVAVAVPAWGLVLEAQGQTAAGTGLLAMVLFGAWLHSRRVERQRRRFTNQNA